jgi:hypothetical protein
MAKFTVNVPVVQPEPTVKVDVTPTAPLPLGINRFRLVVVDNAGNQSAPITLEVKVVDLDKPTAILEVLDDAGRRIDPVIGFGKTFVLSGTRSTDLPPGKITEYQFTLLDTVA